VKLTIAPTLLCCFMMFGLAAISEEPCLINLPQELSLEIIQSSNPVVQREEVVNMLQKSGRKVVAHPDSWAPKLGIHIEETVSDSFVLQYSLSQSHYEQTDNGAKYEYVTDLLCNVTEVEDVLWSIRSAILESENQP
jgi:hypothetical protein